ncbi:hypothetical protein ABIF16_009452 [Bradyrhizobium elkanii]
MVRTATPATAKAAGNSKASRPTVTAPVVDSTELDAAVAQEALESGAPGCGIADRFGELGFAGQARQLLLPQIEERFDDGGRPFLACFHPRCRILAADVGLDRPKPGHCRDGLCRQLRALVDVKLVESPPDVGKAGCQRYALIGARGPREPIIGGIADGVDAPRRHRLCQDVRVLKPGKEDVRGRG